MSHIPIIITIIVIILLIVIIMYKYIPSEKFVKSNGVYTMSRPNCLQLNSPDVCKSTLGCLSRENGCINNFKQLQEPQKAWEKDDFMIIY